MSETINVKAYGAAGDGITDDSRAINKALEKGGEIYIPAGEYLLGENLVIGSHTHITADKAAHLFRKAHTQITRKDYLLTNADPVNGNEDIALSGGVWDGNCYPEDRGNDLFAPESTTGVMLNFRKVKGLTLRDMVLRDALCYYTRFCEAEDVEIERIRFASERIVPNQDGIHLAGYCRNFRIRDLYGEAGSPNDDFLALNADDASQRQECFDSVNGPIENITAENIHSELCHCFVRLLSVQSDIRNVTIRNVTGKCKYNAFNMDAARNCRVPLFKESDYPNGVGNIENVKIEKVSVSNENAGEALFRIETNLKGFRVADFENRDGEKCLFARVKNTAAFHFTYETAEGTRSENAAANAEVPFYAEKVGSFAFDVKE